MEQVYTIDEIKRKLLPIFTEVPIKKAVLFGSYANGTADTKSDVDLLVDSGLEGFDFLLLREDIYGALGIEVDVFDVTHIIVGSKIDNEINNNGVIIYDEMQSY